MLIGDFFSYCRPSTQGNHLTVQVQQDIIGLSFQRDSRFPFCLFSSLLLKYLFFFFIASAAQNSMPWGWWGKMRRIDFWGNSSLNGKLVLSWAFLSVCFSGLWRLAIFRACPARQSKTERHIRLNLLKCRFIPIWLLVEGLFLVFHCLHELCCLQFIRRFLFSSVFVSYRKGVRLGLINTWNIALTIAIISNRKNKTCYIL